MPLRLLQLRQQQTVVASVRLQERIYQAGAGSLQPCKPGIDFLALEWLLDSQGIVSGPGLQRSRSTCQDICQAMAKTARHEVWGSGTAHVSLNVLLLMGP